MPTISDLQIYKAASLFRSAFSQAVGILPKVRKPAFPCNSESASNPSITCRPSSPSAIPLRELVINLPRLFPRSIKESVRDYFAFRKDAGTLQHQLLSTLPFFPVAGDDKVAEVVQTPVDEQANYINEFCVRPAMPHPSGTLRHLIIVHGYGAGLGFFLKNLEKLNLIDNRWVIHAIDLPGYGFSSRPKFPYKYKSDPAAQAEHWFHARFKTWLEKRGLLQHPEQNMLVAHSMGAYLAALYANKYPNHFKKLVMCSPAGICNTPSNKQRRLPPWWFAKLWDRNISPFSLVRNSRLLGSKLTSGWSYRRFGQLLSEGYRGAQQFEAIHKYAYAIFNSPGSGEYLLSFALKCGGDPRDALERRLFHNKMNQFKAKCEWLWLYGDQDWMDVGGGRRVSHFLNTAMGKKSKVEVVHDSGHHLYFDNYEQFNRILEKEMKMWDQ